MRMYARPRHQSAWIIALSLVLTSAIATSFPHAFVARISLANSPIDRLINPYQVLVLFLACMGAMLGASRLPSWEATGRRPTTLLHKSWVLIVWSGVAACIYAPLLGPVIRQAMSDPVQASNMARAWITYTQSLTATALSFASLSFIVTSKASWRIGPYLAFAGWLALVAWQSMGTQATWYLPFHGDPATRTGHVAGSILLAAVLCAVALWVWNGGVPARPDRSRQPRLASIPSRAISRT